MGEGTRGNTERDGAPVGSEPPGRHKANPTGDPETPPLTSRHQRQNIASTLPRTHEAELESEELSCSWAKHLLHFAPRRIGAGSDAPSSCLVCKTMPNFQPHLAVQEAGGTLLEPRRTACTTPLWSLTTKS